MSVVGNLFVIISEPKKRFALRDPDDFIWCDVLNDFITKYPSMDYPKPKNETDSYMHRQDLAEAWRSIS